MGKAFSKSVSKGKELVFNKNYLERCQIDTPEHIAEWAWSMAHQLRKGKFSSVLDLGCGDARFSLYGNYKSYNGIEIDQNRTVVSSMPKNATIIHDCALLSEFNGFDLCIGNPPYVRHHDMDNKWREAIVKCLGDYADIEMDRRGNAFLYFMLKALVSTKDNGLVVLIVPFEWVSRPSSAWLRSYIEENRWSASIYRLPEYVFDGVLTTASLTIIDKSSTMPDWNYYKVNNNFEIKKTVSPTGSRCKVLQYKKRDSSVFAQRGLSPGTQNVFCLTEEKRLHHRLKIGVDVVPCVTTLKPLPSEIKTLTENVFYKYYVSAGVRCWLIRSDKEISNCLDSYLKKIEFDDRNTSTCINRNVWYKYSYPRIPELLLGTGFVSFGPHFLENQVGAIAVGSVGNIYIDRKYSKRNIVNKLRKINFEHRVVNQAGKLKKIEINQLNTVLQNIINIKS